MKTDGQSHTRSGGVYIAVLGTALIVSLLGISALVTQRIQNQMLVASTDIRQAQLNAETAAELGVLAIKQDVNWRNQRDVQSYLIKDRELVLGGGSSCSLLAFDAPSDASNLADRPIKLVGIGRHGPATGNAPRTAAEQRVEVIIEPDREPHDCLRENNAATLDWSAVFAYYQDPAHSTQIDVNDLPEGHPVANFGRNPGIEEEPISGDPPYWKGEVQGISSIGSADVDQSNNSVRSGNYSLRVQDRSSQNAGASQSVKDFIKPETTYLVEAWVNEEQPGFSNTDLTWRFKLRTKTIGNSAVTVTLVATEGQQSGAWLKLSGTLPTNDWSGELEYAWITLSCDGVWVWDTPPIGHPENPDFYMDDFLIKQDSTTGRFIYKQALGPGVNPFGTPDPNGIYWIDCANQDLYIERTRIRGTLLLLNPGPNSRIDYGPIHLSPHIPGYPTLLVNGNFSIRATNTSLSEAENGCNYNPPGAVNTPGMVHKTLGTDGDMVDVYTDSGINGLVCVSGTLTYKYTPQIRGRVILGGNGGNPINNGSPSVTYVPDSLLNPPPPLGAFYTYRYDSRPASAHKAIVP
jgi:hypothetical protein